jgi:hypothetical protein
VKSRNDDFVALDGMLMLVNKSLIWGIHVQQQLLVKFQDFGLFRFLAD